MRVEFEGFYILHELPPVRMARESIHAGKGSRKVLRSALQDLEKLGYVLKLTIATSFLNRIRKIYLKFLANYLSLTVSKL